MTQARNPSPPSSKRGPLRRVFVWIGKALLLLLALVMLAVVAGLLWQAVASARDARLHPAPGELVDVGGRTLHLVCTGEGTPTVLIEAGAQDWSTGWQRPQVAIARHTRVCSYDRAGLGWSEPSDDPKDGHHMVEDLRRLVVAAEVDRPLVLVGHSLGGMLNRIYSDRYPNDVAALVLLEPGAPDQLAEMFPEANGEPAFGAWVETLAAALTRLGVVRWFYRDLFEGKGYPEAEVAAARARMARPSATRALASTVRHLAVTAEQTRASTSLGDLPVSVVYSTKFDEVGTSFENEAERTEFKRAMVAHWEWLASLSEDGGTPIVLEGANHLTMVRDDRYWPEVVEVIVARVEQVRALSDGGR